jgi:hypothetical protein
MLHDHSEHSRRINTETPMIALMSCVLLFAMALLIATSVLVKHAETFTCATHQTPTVSSWLMMVCSVESASVPVTAHTTVASINRLP